MTDAFFDGYDANFFKLHNNADHAQAYDKLAAIVYSVLRPKSVIDVGAGCGNLLSRLYELSGQTLVYDAVDAPQCRQAIYDAGTEIPIEKYWWRDLRYPQPVFPITHDNPNPGLSDYTRPNAVTTPPYDLAISVEVAEHLPADSAVSYLKFLTDMSDTVLFSGAVPGQGGVGHVNEQEWTYWLSFFNTFGYYYDAHTTNRIREALHGKLAPIWWYEYVGVFRRKTEPLGVDK